ncbi:putative replication factor A2 [Blattamonas nauphoetae]|uniref:Replication factor A2 n=1 Tax=Blattamonas nauphoetae TaxID=2049346 RepID=A0ABQ9YCA4_9EUKA|nr:putative replication factor A2 [Blattamonas nauphoetae]
MGPMNPSDKSFSSSPARAGGAYGGGGDGEDSARRYGTTPQTFVPLSVKMVLSTTKEYTNQPFSIDKFELSTVELIGLLLETIVNGNVIIYKLDDGTGCIDVRQYITTTGEEQIVTPINTGTYARVVGNIRQQGETHEINAFQVSRVEDFNQITFHILLTIQAHIQRTSILTHTDASFVPQSQNQITSPSGQAHNQQSYHGNQQTGNQSFAVQNTYNTYNQHNTSGLTREESLQSACCDALEHLNNGDGSTVLEIKTYLGDRFSHSEIDTKIKDMFESGTLMSGNTFDRYRLP